jgi:ferrous iron transport protein B
MDAPLIALVGNPNSGKTTLFNALTGMRQRVGNYPGVTVEWKEGQAWSQHGKAMRLVDLPGSYSLNARSPDEEILVEALFGKIQGLGTPEVILCCIDASSLERNLYLATQVIELGLPVVVALNMMDVAERRGIGIDVEELGRRLGVEVIPCEAAKGKGIMEVRLALSRAKEPARLDIGIPQLVMEAASELAPVLRGRGEQGERVALAEARLLLSCDADPGVGGPLWTRIQLWQQRFDREIPGWRSEWITTRYAWIGGLMRDTVKRRNPNRRSLSERVDAVLLHPWIGFPVLALVMGILFYSIFSLAGPFMDAIDAGIGWVGVLFERALPESPLRELLVDGVIGGVGGVLIFLPQILLLFFFIALLESTGYMARAAFLLDRLMGKVGLHGRSFIPLLSSYACAVPGIMATRTIESPKDRLITIMVAPFMTCSARLPVYLVMIAALLPAGPGHALTKSFLLLCLYFLGTVVALGCAWLFRRTLLKGPVPSLVMELPPYRIPQWRSVLLEMLDRGGVFLKRAGTVIFALSIILWFLMNYPKGAGPDGLSPELAVEAPIVAEVDAEAAIEEASLTLEQSFAGRLGRAMEPAFAPLGYDWKITVGIIASFAAREVFVSTMAIAYRVDEESGDSNLVSTLREARRADGSRLFTPLTCLSILLFFVFALQCISTVAIVRRETRSWRWPLFQFAYMFAFAWVAAFLVYQGGRLIGFS